MSHIVSLRTLFSKSHENNITSLSCTTATSKSRTLRVLLASAVLGFGVIALNGCESTLSSTSIPKEAQYWYGMQSLLNRVEHIKLSGRANFAHGSDRFGTTFVYDGSASNNYTLDLRSSIGTRIAYLVVTPYEASLQADNHEFKAPTASELFKQTLDMDLPLDHFHEILLGIALERSKFNENAILYESNTGNFKIIYRDFKSYGQIALPSDIEITGPNLRLIILPRAVQNLQFKASNTRGPNKVSVDFAGNSSNTTYDPGTAASLGSSAYTNNTATYNTTSSATGAVSNTAYGSATGGSAAVPSATAVGAAAAGAAGAAASSRAGTDPWDTDTKVNLRRTLSKNAVAVDENKGDPWDTPESSAKNVTKAKQNKTLPHAKSAAESTKTKQVPRATLDANLTHNPANEPQRVFPSNNQNHVATRASEGNNQGNLTNSNPNVVYGNTRANNGATTNNRFAIDPRLVNANNQIRNRANAAANGASNSRDSLYQAPQLNQTNAPTPKEIEALRQKQQAALESEQQYRRNNLQSRLESQLESSPNQRAGEMDERNPLNSPNTVLNAPTRQVYVPAPQKLNGSANQQELERLQNRM